MLFCEVWNPRLAETFYSDYTVGWPEALGTVAESVFLTAKLGHSPRAGHKEVKAVNLHRSQMSCPCSLPQLSWHELHLCFLMGETSWSNSLMQPKVHRTWISRNLKEYWVWYKLKQTKQSGLSYFFKLPWTRNPADLQVLVRLHLCVT